MKFSFGGEIGSKCLLFGSKSSEIFWNFVYANCRHPSIPFGIDAKYPGLRSFVRAPLILCVVNLCNQAKIGKLVVRNVAVFMVNVLTRPLTGYIKPYKAMVKMAFTVKSNHPIPAMFMDVPGDLPCFPALRSWCQVFSGKQSGFFGVIKGVSKLFCGNHVKCRLLKTHTV